MLAVLVLVVGAVAGTVLVVFGLVPAFRDYAADQALDERGQRVVGVVDSVDPDGPVKHERMRYHYTVDGRIHHGSGDFTNPDMVGRKIKLIYDPENPGNSRVDLSRDAGAPPRSDSSWPWTPVLVTVGPAAVAVWFLRRQPWWIKRRR
ncbi:hypothetical protein JCM33774_16380 [Actinophytocola sp. KF-1]